MRSFVGLIAFFLILQCINALINQSINPHQLTRFLSDESVKSYESSGEVYSAIKLSKMSDKSIKTSTISPILSQSLTSSDVSELHASIGSLSLLKQAINVPEKSLSTLKSGLRSKNLMILYHSASSLLSLVQSKVVKASDVDFGAILSAINQFEELDHTHRVSLKTEDSSPFFTAFSWRLLGKMLSVDASNKQVTDAAKQALSHASNALSTLKVKKSGEIDASFGLPADITQPQAVGEMISALVYLYQSISDSNKPAFPLSAAEVEKFSQYLIAGSATSDIEEMEAIFAGLFSITQLPANLQPVVVKINQSSNQARVTVTNVMGKPLSITDKLTASLNEKDVKLTKSEQGYVLDAIKSLEPGMHSLTMKLGQQSVDLPFLQTTNVKSASAQIYLSESSKGDDSKAESIVYPNVFPLALKADSSKYLHVRLIVDAAVEPESVLVMLRRTTSSVPELSSDDSPSTSFVARRTSDGSYVARINLGSVDVLDAVSGGGEFIVHVLVAHTLYTKPLDWSVADLSLSAAHLQTDATRYGDVKPTIEHTFRTSENRRAYLLPLIFSIAHGALFVGLVLVVLARTRFSFPIAPLELSSAFAFQATLVLLIALYALYWIQLNIFQGIIATAVLSFAALVTGNKALTARHIRKATKKTM